MGIAWTRNDWTVMNITISGSVKILSNMFTVYVQLML